MTAAASSGPKFLVCEDGHEYSERFQRLLGDVFTFVRVASFAEVMAAVRAEAADAGDGPMGLLLDLDFRRVDPAVLVDDQGLVGGARLDGERRRLAAVQGILILRALRGAGVKLPALLFADLADEEQRAFIEQSLAPVKVMTSNEGIGAIAMALKQLLPAK